MTVTEASVIPDHAFDLTDYKPTRDPVTLFRRFGRGSDIPGAADPTAEETGDVRWGEALRRELANKGRPASPVPMCAAMVETGTACCGFCDGQQGD